MAGRHFLDVQERISDGGERVENQQWGNVSMSRLLFIAFIFVYGEQAREKTLSIIMLSKLESFVKP